MSEAAAASSEPKQRTKRKAAPSGSVDDLPVLASVVSSLASAATAARHYSPLDRAAAGLSAVAAAASAFASGLHPSTATVVSPPVVIVASRVKKKAKTSQPSAHARSKMVERQNANIEALSQAYASQAAKLESDDEEETTNTPAATTAAPPTPAPAASTLASAAAAAAVAAATAAAAAAAAASSAAVPSQAASIGSAGAVAAKSATIGSPTNGLDAGNLLSFAQQAPTAAAAAAAAAAPVREAPKKRTRATVPFNHDDWRVLGVWIARRCAPQILFWIPFFRKNGTQVRAEVGLDSLMKILAPKKKKRITKSFNALDVARAEGQPHVRSLFLHVRVVQRVDDRDQGIGDLRYICTDLGVSYRLGNTGHYWIGDHPDMFQLSCPNWNSSLSRSELEQHLIRGSGKVFASAAAMPTRLFIQSVLQGKGILAQCTLQMPGQLSSLATNRQVEEQKEYLAAAAAAPPPPTSALAPASPLAPFSALLTDTHPWTVEEEHTLRNAMRDAIPFAFHPAPALFTTLSPLLSTFVPSALTPTATPPPRGSAGAAAAAPTAPIAPTPAPVPAPVPMLAMATASPSPPAPAAAAAAPPTAAATPAAAPAAAPAADAHASASSGMGDALSALASLSTTPQQQPVVASASAPAAAAATPAAQVNPPAMIGVSDLTYASEALAAVAAFVDVEGPTSSAPSSPVHSGSSPRKRSVHVRPPGIYRAPVIADPYLPFVQFSTVPITAIPTPIIIPRPNSDETVLATQAAGGNKRPSVRSASSSYAKVTALAPMQQLIDASKVTTINSLIKDMMMPDAVTAAASAAAASSQLPPLSSSSMPTFHSMPATATVSLSHLKQLQQVYQTAASNSATNVAMRMFPAMSSNMSPNSGFMHAYWNAPPGLMATVKPENVKLESGGTTSTSISSGEAVATAAAAANAMSDVALPSPTPSSAGPSSSFSDAVLSLLMSNQRPQETDPARVRLRQLETELRARPDLQPIYLAAIHQAAFVKEQQRHQFVTAVAAASSAADSSATSAAAAAPLPEAPTASPLSAAEALNILAIVDESVLRQWVAQLKLTPTQEVAWHMSRKERNHIADSLAKLAHTSARS